MTTVRPHRRRTPSGASTSVRSHERASSSREKWERKEAETGRYACSECGARFHSSLQALTHTDKAHRTPKRADVSGNTWPEEEKLSPGEETELRELDLWVDNNEPLYRQEQSIKTNYRRKLANDSFDKSRAADGYDHLADAASRDYDRQVGTPGQPTFTKRVRREWAKRRARESYPYEE